MQTGDLIGMTHTVHGGIRHTALAIVIRNVIRNCRLHIFNVSRSERLFSGVLSSQDNISGSSRCDLPQDHQEHGAQKTSCAFLVRQRFAHQVTQSALMPCSCNWHLRQLSALVSNESPARVALGRPPRCRRRQISRRSPCQNHWHAQTDSHLGFRDYI